MPIYEYRCELCGEKFEKLVRTVSGHVEVVCPKCGSDEVKKAISLFGTSGSAQSTGSSSCAPNSV